jgi:hypothetical protein
MHGMIITQKKIFYYFTVSGFVKRKVCGMFRSVQIIGANGWN